MCIWETKPHVAISYTIYLSFASNLSSFIHYTHLPYAYDVVISLHPPLGEIGLCVNAVVGDVPAADHNRVQGSGFVPKHGGAMTSMHKVYKTNTLEY